MSAKKGKPKGKPKLDDFFGKGAEAYVRACAKDVKKLAKAAEEQELPPGIACRKREIADVTMALGSVAVKKGKRRLPDVNLDLDLKAIAANPLGEPVYVVSAPGTTPSDVTEAKQRKASHDLLMAAAKTIGWIAKKALTGETKKPKNRRSPR